MRFHIRYAYNLDLLNLMSVLTGESLYVNAHPEAFERFGKSLSDYSNNCLQKAVEINGNAMLGPALCHGLSAYPWFENLNILRLEQVLVPLLTGVRWVPLISQKWEEEEIVIRSILPVVKEVESMGFREYWERERLPLIKQGQDELYQFIGQFPLEDEIEGMLGHGKAPRRIILYLCTFAAPHGMKLHGARFISDVSYSKEDTLGMIAIHELFHPPYNAKQLSEELDALGEDPLLKRAFAEKDPQYGYLTMGSFIEENVVEAMTLSIGEKLGWETDPMGYLARHDEGSHMLSVVLLEYFKRYPKLQGQTFHQYFKELVRKLPIGLLDREYERIQQEEESEEE